MDQYQFEQQQIEYFMKSTTHGMRRVAAISPKVHRGKPLECAHEHWKLIKQAYRLGAQVIVAPELGVSGGYQLGDLQQQPALHRQRDQAILWLIDQTRSINAMVVFGASINIHGLLFNGAFVVQRGKILGVTIKENLPDYGVFRERRWFRSAHELLVDQVTQYGQTFPVGTRHVYFSTIDPLLTITVDICEDVWMPFPPSRFAIAAGAFIHCNLSASPYRVGVTKWRRHIARETGTTLSAMIYAAAGSTESTGSTVNDGHSIIADRGTIIREVGGKGWDKNPQRFSDKGTMIIADININGILADRTRTTTYAENVVGPVKAFPVKWIPFDSDLAHPNPQKYRYILRHFDPSPFVAKNREDRRDMLFARMAGLRTRLAHLPPDKRKLIIGVSGGVDSTDVLMGLYELVKKYGQKLGMTTKDIIAITMPGFGTSSTTFDYATALAEELGVTFYTRSIAEIASLVYAIVGQPTITKRLSDSSAYHMLEQFVQTLQPAQMAAYSRPPIELANLMYLITTKPHLLERMEGNSVLKLLFENVQAWCRKLIELATAAAEGGIVIGTSSSTELVIGWFTAFGDGSSHFAFNAGMAKSAVRAELMWLARRYEKTNPRLSELLRAIALSIASPELLPLGQDGQAIQASEEINGPDMVRDFFEYWMMRMLVEPATVYRFALEAYGDQYTPQQLYRWLHNWIRRMFVFRFKINIQTIDTVIVGVIAPGAHEYTLIPSDIEPETWLQNLNDYVPNWFKPVDMAA